MCRCSCFVLLIVKSRNMSGWCMYHVHCCTSFEHTAVLFLVCVAVVLSLPALLYPSYMGTSSCVHDCWWAARTAACCIIKATPTIVECCIVSFTATTRAALGVVFIFALRMYVLLLECFVSVKNVLAVIQQLTAVGTINIYKKHARISQVPMMPHALLLVYFCSLFTYFSKH